VIKLRAAEFIVETCGGRDDRLNQWGKNMVGGNKQADSNLE